MQENQVYNIDGWQVTMPAHWQFYVDAQAKPPQYIFQEPYNRLVVCFSSCTFQDESSSGVPEPGSLQLLFSTACEQMGMRPLITQLGTVMVENLAAYYPPGFSTLAYRGLTKDGDIMVGFGIFAPGVMLMVYFVGADEEDFGGDNFGGNRPDNESYFSYVRLIRRYLD